MVIHLQVRRFRCVETDCEQKIFSEQAPQLAERYQRRTPALARLLERVGLALGGRAGSRMTRHLGVPVSRPTLLRLVRRLEVGEPGLLPAVGIDDFAIRRGHNYGTVIVDMATHRPVDLLDDRSADSTAAWLAKHPEIQVVCRDRGGCYCEGATVGAPDAIQVADRWHLLHNLADAVDKTVRAHAKCLAEPAEPGPDSVEQPKFPAPADVTVEPGRRETTTRARHAEIRDLARAGVSIHAISRKLDLDRKTVRYAEFLSGVLDSPSLTKVNRLV